MLQTADRLRHSIAGAFARESLAYCIPLPDEDMLALIYTWVDGADRAGYAFAIYERGPQMAYFQHIDGVPAHGANFDAWNIGGVRVSVGPELLTASAAYDDDHVSIAVEFTGLHDAFDYEANAGGCPAYQATNRYEQSGRMRGRLDWDGRIIDIDVPGHRDHSWGRRDWDAIHHYKWLAVAGQDRAANIMVALVEGETLYNGYVFLDGILSPITSAHIDTDYAVDFAQTHVTAIVHDEAGRSTSMQFPHRFAYGRWDVSPTFNFTDGCFAGDVAGGPVSAYIQYAWPRVYLDHLLTRSADRDAAELQQTPAAPS